MGRGVSFKHLSSLRNGPRQPRKLQPRSDFNSAKMTTVCKTFSPLNEAYFYFSRNVSLNLESTKRKKLLSQLQL